MRASTLTQRSASCLQRRGELKPPALRLSCQRQLQQAAAVRSCLPPWLPLQPSCNAWGLIAHLLPMCACPLASGSGLEDQLCAPKCLPCAALCAGISSSRWARSSRLCVVSRLVLTPTGNGSTEHIGEEIAMPSAIELKEGLFEVCGRGSRCVSHYSCYHCDCYSNRRPVQPQQLLLRVHMVCICRVA